MTLPSAISCTFAELSAKRVAIEDQIRLQAGILIEE